MPINHIQQMAFNDAKSFRLEENVDAIGTSVINSKEARERLAALLYQLYHSALTYGKQDNKNIELVIDMLKLSGKYLEDIDRKYTGHGTNVIKMHEISNWLLTC